MGFKTFVNGDILDASEVNDFLMKQSVMVFADAAARTTALPSPIEGMVTYLQDADELFLYDGANWVVVVEDPTISVFNAQTGTTYTLVASDAGKLVTLSNAASITLTVPAEATTVFPVGQRIDIVQLGDGQVSVAEADGVSVNAFDDADKLRGKHAAATLIYQGSDNWLLVGAIEA
jgi:hypothetical protein